MCKTNLVFTLRREHNLQLFVNKLLKKLSGPGIDYVDGEQRISEVMNIIIYGAHLVMQSVTLIFSLSTASLARNVLQVNPVSTRN